MGALLSCMSEKKVKRRAQPPRRRPSSSGASAAGADLGTLSTAFGSSKGRSKRKDKSEETVIREQALAAALLLQQNGVALPFDRSSSLRCYAPRQKQENLIRSSSTRTRSLADPLLQPHQLIGQDLKIDELETATIVLVHGGGFGAWCWYKTIAYLEECGFTVIALDLAGCGVHSSDPNNITSLSQYTKPLIDFLEKIPDGEKVILAGHDLGGTCISSAMEIFPSKIAKAVFIAAPMLKNGQSTLDIFSLQEGAAEFIYGNGHENPPTSVDLKKSTIKDLLFNQSPSKDIALASVSMRVVPLAPLLEKLSLSSGGYGSVRRFYVETTEDNMMPLSLQRTMCSVDPPERVLRVKGADHSPFFSKPQALHRLLVEIAKLPKDNAAAPPPLTQV